MAVSPGTLQEYGEHVRRKFKEHDIVRYLDEPNIVTRDETEDGAVRMVGHCATYDHIELLCPAEVVRKMKPWKRRGEAQ